MLLSLANLPHGVETQPVGLEQFQVDLRAVADLTEIVVPPRHVEFRSLRRDDRLAFQILDVLDEARDGAVLRLRMGVEKHEHIATSVPCAKRFRGADAEPFGMLDHTNLRKPAQKLVRRAVGGTVVGYDDFIVETGRRFDTRLDRLPKTVAFFEGRNDDAGAHETPQYLRFEGLTVVASR